MTRTVARPVSEGRPEQTLGKPDPIGDVSAVLAPRRTYAFFWGLISSLVWTIGFLLWSWHGLREDRITHTESPELSALLIAATSSGSDPRSIARREQSLAALPPGLREEVNRLESAHRSRELGGPETQ